MTSVKPRRSAFSVYAEGQPEPTAQSKMIDTTRIIKINDTVNNGNHNNNNNRNRSKRQRKNRNKQNKPTMQITAMTVLNNTHLNRVSKPKSNARDTKKAQAKFGKITNENINECISMFSANPTPAFTASKAPAKKVLQSTPFYAPKPQSNLKLTKNLKHIIESHEQEDSADELISEHVEIFDSRQEAVNLFKSIVYPVKIKEFFSEYWEKKPMLIRREDPEHNKAWFSCKEFDTILRNHTLEFTTNIDVVTYIDEVKQNHNKEGRAFAPL